MKFLSQKSKLLPHQGGFSLIEMMVSIPLGLLVMLAVMKIFTTNVQSVYLQNAYARVQENGRMATELITRNIRGADYWGCVGDISSITNRLDPNDGDYVADNLPVGTAITGSNNVTSETISTITVLDNTDTLTLKGARSIAGVKIEAAMNAYSDDVTVTADNGIEEGDLLLISNCQKGDLFTNSYDNTDASGKIQHKTGAITGGIANKDLDLSARYDNSAQILIPTANVYFIGVNPSGSHSLYRSSNGVASELVRGVKNLQIIYGEDTTDNGSADTFSDANNVTNMDNVLSIRVSLTAESGGSSSGTPIERTYEVTANIRNRTLQ